MNHPNLRNFAPLMLGLFTIFLAAYGSYRVVFPLELTSRPAVPKLEGWQNQKSSIPVSKQ